MDIEIILLVSLIIVFIVSFCGLIQKIRKSYERDREYTAERITNASSPPLSLSEIYINPSFTTEAISPGNQSENVAVFPGAPPPYIDAYYEPPPKYEDIIKIENGEASCSGVETRAVEPG